MKTVLFYLVVAVLGITVNVAANASKFVVANDGEVTGYFYGSFADYKNEMTVNFSDPTIDSPFISSLSNIGDSFSYGVHEKGAQAVFVNHVLDTNEWYYSLTKFNDDGVNHVYTKDVVLTGGTHGLLVAFEDVRGGGDFDMNDSMAIFTNVVMAPVPEPSTYLMLLVGFALIGFTVKRNKTRLGFQSYK